MGWCCLLHTTDRCDCVCRWCMAVTSETLATSRVWAPWWTTGSRPPPSRRSLKWPDVSDHVLVCSHFVLPGLVIQCCILWYSPQSKKFEVARCKQSCLCLESLCCAIYYSVVLPLCLLTLRSLRWPDVSDKTFVTTKIFCCDKHNFVATSILLLRQKMCFVTTNTCLCFVVTKIILVAASANDSLCLESFCVVRCCVAIMSTAIQEFEVAWCKW